jgi:hypothetical protein
MVVDPQVAGEDNDAGAHGLIVAGGRDRRKISSSGSWIVCEHATPMTLDTILRLRGNREEGNQIMAGMDRRSFLARGSMMVAAAGAVAAVPGISDELLAAESDLPAVDTVIGGEVGPLTEPLVVHVRDLATGEIGLFSGTREVIVRDPGLAGRLFHASR